MPLAKFALAAAIIPSLNVLVAGIAILSLSGAPLTERERDLRQAVQVIAAAERTKREFGKFAKLEIE